MQYLLAIQNQPPSDEGNLPPLDDNGIIAPPYTPFSPPVDPQETQLQVQSPPLPLHHRKFIRIPDKIDGKIIAPPYTPFSPPVDPQDTQPQVQSSPLPLHHRRLLKQIFIPLPPPNSEAEKEIEGGEPVNGLPFPLNFVVSKILAKMLKNRGHKLIASKF